MKHVSLIILFSAVSILLFSQEFDVPQNYKLEKAEDYAPYEQDVINCVDWIMQTPVNVQMQKRQLANKFLFDWLSGSPNVTVEIKTEIVTFMSSSPELLLIFMGGWTRYSLENNDYSNKMAGILAGIESVIDFYQKNKDALGKDKNVEKYIKMKSKGELIQYIEANAW